MKKVTNLHMRFLPSYASALVFQGIKYEGW